MTHDSLLFVSPKCEFECELRNNIQTSIISRPQIMSHSLRDPDSWVGAPGGSANCESREVAKVIVVKGTDESLTGGRSLGGRSLGGR